MYIHERHTIHTCTMDCGSSYGGTSVHTQGVYLISEVSANIEEDISSNVGQKFIFSDLGGGRWGEGGRGELVC